MNNNFIIDNIFSEDEISAIYSHIENTPEDKIHLQKQFNHTAYFSWLPDKVVKRIEQVVAENFEKPLILRELSFARYDTKNGKPLLFPHYDEAFKEERTTIDIQVKSTIPWAIVVEGIPYTLKDNQALVFRGTHQVHWREKIEFTKDDHVDMIFCHFSEPIEIAVPNSEEHYREMKIRKKKYLDEYYAN